MAQGPDPNRHPETDPELSGVEQRKGGGMGSPRSTRFGLSSGAIAVLILLFTVAILFLLR